MGFDLEERARKSFLYADLFKQEAENSVMMSASTQWRSPSSSDSSSSGFTTPFSSELDSSESDDVDFAAHLSRQMAECMLHEEEEEENDQQTNSLSKYGRFNSNRPFLADHVNRTNPCIKNQSAVGVSSGGRVKGDELTQQMQTRKTERSFGRCRDGNWRSGSGRKGHTGSGMRAIFLGGPGSKNGSSGTGVFLPQVTKNPADQKKKSGLSTVLIPTRVLEALELHFTRLPDTAAAPLTTAGSSPHASPRDERMRWKGQENIHTKFKVEAANKVDEMQILPQEWTY